MSPWTLFIGIVTSSIGLAYCVYGKKQQRFVPLLAGIALMVVPYFVGDPLVLVAISAALVIIPFVWRD